jgi:hypothetical protein
LVSSPVLFGSVIGLLLSRGDWRCARDYRAGSCSQNAKKVAPADVWIKSIVHVRHRVRDRQTLSCGAIVRLPVEITCERACAPWWATAATSPFAVTKAPRASINSTIACCRRQSKSSLRRHSNAGPFSPLRRYCCDCSALAQIADDLLEALNLCERSRGRRSNTASEEKPPQDRASAACGRH